MEAKAEAELVFVPAPGLIGHIVSTIELAKLITQRDSRISVVILILNDTTNSSKINAFIESKSSSLNNTRLTLLTLPISFCNTSFVQHQEIINLQVPHIIEAIENRIEAGSRLAGFVLDMFCTSIAEVADHFKLPSYIYFSSGFNFLNILLHSQSLADDDGVDVATEFSNREAEFEFPGFASPLSGRFIPAVLLDKKEGCSWILGHAKRFRKSKGILVNTYAELEDFGMQALVDQAAKNSIPQVYPVGPILELDNSRSQGDDHGSIMKWLDDQPSSSVVFICFGSIGSFDTEQIKEIANGLEKSEYRFLWSLSKSPSNEKDNEDGLPEGFLDRTSARGKIIGWAPQVSILGHEAVGGFVSHCGWNSTLESLWFGVPVATWPLFGDQQINALKLVKELELAVEIRMDYQYDFKTRKGVDFIVTAEELANGVKKLMTLDENTKKKVKEMGDKGKNALKEGNSSNKWLGCFIQDVLSNVTLI